MTDKDIGVRRSEVEGRREEVEGPAEAGRYD
jgi:hypothetical protein